MDFSLKYYDDVYNVQLQKRFHNCYRLDLMENGVSVVSIITDFSSGTLFSERLSNISFHGTWYSKYTHVAIDGEQIAKLKVSTGALLSRKSYLELNDGTRFHLEYKSALFENQVSYEYRLNGTLACGFYTSTKQKLFSTPAAMNYQGQVTYDPKINNQQILLLLIHFCLQQLNYNY